MNALVLKQYVSCDYLAVSGHSYFAKPHDEYRLSFLACDYYFLIDICTDIH